MRGGKTNIRSLLCSAASEVTGSGSLLKLDDNSDTKLLVWPAGVIINYFALSHDNIF